MRIGSLLVLFVLAGVVNAQEAAAPPPPTGSSVLINNPAPQPSCDNCGVVTAIAIEYEDQEWQPLGVVASANSMSSVTGSEGRSAFAFGRGGESKGLVLIGANGGAVYAKRPNQYKRERWDVTVRMDRGETRVLSQRYEPMVHEGDRVRVMGTQLELVGN